MGWKKDSAQYFFGFFSCVGQHAGQQQKNRRGRMRHLVKTVIHYYIVPNNRQPPFSLSLSPSLIPFTDLPETFVDNPFLISFEAFVPPEILSYFQDSSLAYFPY